MSSIDDLIRKRLEKLRDNTPLQSAGSTSRVNTHTVKKTAAEEVESLLAQLSEETSLDSEVVKGGLDIDSQIRIRLERLKSREGCHFASSSQSSQHKVSSEGIEDDNFFKTSSCTALLAELKNCETNDSISSEDSDVSSEDSDNLCVICSEKKPSLMCLGCDKDCFCNKCYNEFHSDEDDHSTVPYLQKKLKNKK